MTTLKRIESNRRNAQRSTGPKTPAGKAFARLNAVSHGLRAASPVVPGEDPAAWEAFREAMVADLAPVGILETELAERVALLSWRLRRVSGFETGVVSRASEKAARTVRGEGGDRPYGGKETVDGRPTLAAVQMRVRSAEQAATAHAEDARLLAALAAAPDDARFDGWDALHILDLLAEHLPSNDEDDDFALDDDFDLDDDEESDPMTIPRHRRFLLALNVPEEAHDEPGGWCGWTAGAVRAGAERIARSAELTRDRLLHRAAAHATAAAGAEQERLAGFRRELAEVEQRTVQDEAAARQRVLVPVEFVDTVMKYEGHIQRQLVQALHELERRQALRSDCPPHPPAALDVTVHAAEGVTLPALPGG